MTRYRQLAWIGLALAAVALLAIAAFGGAEPATETERMQERVQALSEAFACPECDGQSVAESNAAVAASIREFIRDEVAAGSTDRQIRDDLLVSYGTDVLLTPPAEGFSALVWILPVVVAVLGFGGVAAVVRRRPSGQRTASAEDAELVERARTESQTRD